MKIPSALLGCLLILGTSFGTQAQTRQQKDSIANAKIADLINRQDYKFSAESVYPMGGEPRSLTSDYYSLSVSKDTVKADLPYFGRAYSVPIGATSSGIQFTSTKFGYTSTPKKKGGWDITIKPGDSQDVKVLNLSVSATGYTTLNVTSVNRPPISFYGDIVPMGKTK